jgi:hypothetical protein
MGIGQGRLLRPHECRHWRGLGQPGRIGSGQRSGGLSGPDRVRATASVSNDAWHRVAASIERRNKLRHGKPKGPAAGNARRCLVADLMA